MDWYQINKSSKLITVLSEGNWGILEEMEETIICFEIKILKVVGGNDGRIKWWYVKDCGKKWWDLIH